MCINILPTWVFVYYMHGGRKGAMDPLELELQVLVTMCVHRIKSGLLEEQPLLWTVEPSLQPMTTCFVILDFSIEIVISLYVNYILECVFF